MPLRKHEKLFEEMRRRFHAGELADSGIVWSIERLARLFEVSTTTMNRVLRSLASHGVLRKDDGRNRYVFPGGLSVAEERRTYRRNPRVEASRTAAKRIGHDIALGRFRFSGSLPSLRHLQRQYRCSFETIKKAMGELENVGIVESRGARYFPVFRKPADDSTRFYITGLSRMLSGPITMRIVRGVERASDEAGLGPPLFFFSDSKHAAPPPRDHRVAGYIALRQDEEKPYHIAQRIQPNVPYVKIDMEGRVEDVRIEPRLHFTIQPDNKAAGIEIGTYLFQLGHRRMAFFSHISEDRPWITQRLAGLREVFEHPDGGCSLSALFGKVRGDEFPVSNRDAVHAAIGPGASRFVPRLFHDHVLKQTIGRARSLMTIARGMAPHFKAALRDESITAWVCCNDECAYAALQFLSYQGVPVPERVSVVGFDNLDLSPGLDLAAYDFEAERIGEAALRCLLNPSSAAARNGVLVRTKGKLIPRGSAGPNRN